MARSILFLASLLAARAAPAAAQSEMIEVEPRRAAPCRADRQRGRRWSSPRRGSSITAILRRCRGPTGRWSSTTCATAGASRRVERRRRDLPPGRTSPMSRRCGRHCRRRAGRDLLGYSYLGMMVDALCRSSIPGGSTGCVQLGPVAMQLRYATIRADLVGPIRAGHPTGGIGRRSRALRTRQGDGRSKLRTRITAEDRETLHRLLADRRPAPRGAHRLVGPLRRWKMSGRSISSVTWASISLARCTTFSRRASLRAGSRRRC